MNPTIKALLRALIEEHIRAVSYEEEEGQGKNHLEALEAGRQQDYAQDCSACAVLAALAEHVRVLREG